MFLAEYSGFVFVAALIAGLIVLILAAMEFGWRRGNRRVMRDPEGAEKGTTTMDSAVFALLGLLLAFVFSGAASRFGDRRELINDEANAIGTAYLRIGLLPADSQPELRNLYRQYVEVRLKSSAIALQGGVDDTSRVQNEIWKLTLAALQQHQGPPIVDAVLDPVNEMIDITSTRWLAARTHPPMVIYALLVGLAMVCGFLGGYNMGVARRRHALHAVAFALSISLVLYVIIDVEFPRVGLIRVDFADAVLVNLLNSMPAVR
ncbi:MAG TPA: hypothetical protein VN259_07010 [Xanthomonadales bacterium]|nr:hypothetical protein [Xanthomonadales bacterium]